MTGRHSGSFNLFKSPAAKQSLVKNYATKLLATVERQMDRVGSKFIKFASRHGGLRFVVMVDKTGSRPIYRVRVTREPSRSYPEQVSALPTAYVFMESGLCRALGRLESFDTRIYYTAELLADYTSANESKWLDWLHIKTLKSIVRTYSDGMPSLALNNTSRLDKFTYGINYGAHSGKTLLLWQALAGTRNITRANYSGQTIS